MKRITQKKAFTMVEAMVVVGILSLLAAMFFRVWGSLRHSVQPTVSDKAVVQYEAVRCADILVNHIREGLEVVRPLLAESAPFLVMKDATNKMNALYLEPDVSASISTKKSLYKLVSHTSDYSGTLDKNARRVMFGSIKSLLFTSTTPNKIQIDLTIANTKGEFRFLTDVGFLNSVDAE